METKLSKFKVQAAYDRANREAREASARFRKTTELYRAGKIHDRAFLHEQAEHKKALEAFDQAEAQLKALLAAEEASS